MNEIRTTRTTEEVSLGWRVNIEKLERGERREWLERTKNETK